MNASVVSRGQFVELTMRAEVYDYLRGMLRRFALCEETYADYFWLEHFLGELETRDTERER